LVKQGFAVAAVTANRKLATIAAVPGWLLRILAFWYCMYSAQCRWKPSLPIAPKKVAAAVALRVDHLQGETGSHLTDKRSPAKNCQMS
jgi:hypothetical protein